MANSDQHLESKHVEKMLLTLSNMIDRCREIRDLDTYNAYTALHVGFFDNPKFTLSNSTLDNPRLAPMVLELKKLTDERFIPYRAAILEELDDLITNCNAVTGIKKWNQYTEHYITFLNKYGKKDDDGEIRISTPDITISKLLSRLNIDLTAKTVDLEKYNDEMISKYKALIEECRAVHDLETWNAYAIHGRTFLEEYGDVDEATGIFTIFPINDKMSGILVTLIEEMSVCENEKKLQLGISD